MGKDKYRNRNSGGGNNRGGNNQNNNSSHQNQNNSQGAYRGNNFNPSHQNQSSQNSNNNQGTYKGKNFNPSYHNQNNNQNNNPNNNNQGAYRGKNFNPNYQNQNQNQNQNRNQNNSWNNGQNQTNNWNNSNRSNQQNGNNQNNRNQNNQQNGNWKRRRNHYWQPITGANVGEDEVLTMFEAHTIQIATLAQNFATLSRSVGGYYKSEEEFIEKHRAQIYNCKLFYIQGNLEDSSITPHVVAEHIEQFLEQHAAYIYRLYLYFIPQTRDPSWRMLDFLIHIRQDASYRWEPLITIDSTQAFDGEDVIMVDNGGSYTISLCQFCNFAPLPYLTLRYGLVDPDVTGHSY
ncbi:hypothetical protein QBC40DRAFT_153842, partial [Triangularia verruculosa]